MAEIIDIETARISLNDGQIPGVPRNPRFIRDSRYRDLKRSVSEDPEFMWYNPVVLYPLGDGYVVIGGNMRLRVCRELRWKTIPSVILPEDLPAEKIRAYVMKHNIQFGDDDWDLLTSEWDAEELKEWGKEMEWAEPGREEPKEDSKGKDDEEERFILEVECGNDMELDLLYAELTERDYKCTRRR